MVVITLRPMLGHFVGFRMRLKRWQRDGSRQQQNDNRK